MKPIVLTSHARQRLAERGTTEEEFYAGKDVRPIFVDEGERIVVVRLYVYFNQRAEP